MLDLYFFLLISLMGSDNFQERERASVEFSKVCEFLPDVSEEYALTHKDLEIRNRSKRAFKGKNKIVFTKLLFVDEIIEKLKERGWRHHTSTWRSAGRDIDANSEWELGFIFDP